MDLESVSSALESVEDNELTITPDSISNVEGVTNEIKANGSCLNEVPDSGTRVNVDVQRVSHDGQVREGVGVEQVRNSVPNSPPLTATSPPEGSPPPPTMKGYGLRKWRRIKRDVIKDSGANSDSSKALKRGLSTSGNANKPTNSKSADGRHNIEDSVGSVNMLRNSGAVADGLVINGGFNLEPRFLVGAALATALDSENSDDQSSKSSTAASAPRMRHDLPAVLGYVREKSRIKNTSGNHVISSAQQMPLGKGQVEGSKKARGERVKIEKENSHSSIDSDSRSSVFVFMQGAYSVTSNRKQNRISMSYSGENGDGAHADEEQFSEEVQTKYHQENAGEAEDHLLDDLAADASWEDKEDKGGNSQPMTDLDPLAESIRTLQSLQEALETEVHRLGELGKGSIGTMDVGPGTNEPSSPNQFDSEVNRQSKSLEFQISSLTEKIKDLEIRLNAANSTLKVKESRITALEVTLNADRSLKKESANGGDLKHSSGEVDSDMDNLYKQRIEAEVEYLALKKTIQKLRVAAGDPVTLLDEQEALAGEQVQVLNKLGEAENKAALLKKQAEELQKYCGDILGTDEVLKMESKVCKVASCFFIQLILLVLFFWSLVMQLFSPSGDIVPT